MNRVAVRLSVAFCLGLAAIPPVAAAQEATGATSHWNLPELMRELARVKSASAQFTERKTMHMLNAPLATSGMLVYVAPDRMEKVTLTPMHERFVLERNRVTITGGPNNLTQTFLLTNYPEIGGLVEGIRATLAGDLPTLKRFYAVGLGGDWVHWQLLLQPKAAELAHFVKWIRIRGSGDRIDEVESEGSSGDLTEMSVDEDVSNAR
ncbi:MAG TPA: LolA-related protein [Stellaceae bacterium]|nr:LolA-related protein [Stellaceae bacterium]